MVLNPIVSWLHKHSPPHAFVVVILWDAATHRSDYYDRPVCDSAVDRPMAGTVASARNSLRPSDPDRIAYAKLSGVRERYPAVMNEIQAKCCSRRNDRNIFAQIDAWFGWRLSPASSLPSCCWSFVLANPPLSWPHLWRSYPTVIACRRIGLSRA